VQLLAIKCLLLGLLAQAMRLLVGTRQPLPMQQHTPQQHGPFKTALNQSMLMALKSTRLITTSQAWQLMGSLRH